MSWPRVAPKAVFLSADVKRQVALIHPKVPHTKLFVGPRAKRARALYRRCCRETAVSEYLACERKVPVLAPKTGFRPMKREKLKLL